MNVEEKASTLVENWLNSQESTAMVHRDAQQVLCAAIADALRAAARESDRQGDMAEAADTATERVYDKLRAGFRVVWGPDGVEVGTVKLHEDDGDSSVGISASRWYEIELDEPFAAAIKNATGQTGNPFVAMFGDQADRAMRVAGAEIQPAAMRPPTGHIIDETGAMRRVLGDGLATLASGEVVGNNAVIWFPGRVTGRQKIKTDPRSRVNKCDHFARAYSTRAAAEAARGAEG